MRGCDCSVSGPRRSAGGVDNKAIAFATLTSLLSSSCCLIQVALSSIGAGCAGFAVLEPYKGFFRGITLATVLHTLFRHGLTLRTLLSTLLIALITSSQMALALHNQGRLLPVRQLGRALEVVSSYKVLPASWILALQKQLSLLLEKRDVQICQETSLVVEGMKCEGCANYLKGVLSKLEGVKSCRVDFKTKQVHIFYCSPGISLSELEQAISNVDVAYHPIRVHESLGERLKG